EPYAPQLVVDVTGWGREERESFVRYMEAQRPPKGTTDEECVAAALRAYERNAKRIADVRERQQRAAFEGARIELPRRDIERLLERSIDETAAVRTVRSWLKADRRILVLIGGV